MCSSSFVSRVRPKSRVFSSRGRARIVAVLVVLAATSLLVPSAASPATSSRTTFLLSRAVDGGVPNGVSRNPALSHDQRIASFVAYESDASNIVDGDANGTTDVFVVRRAAPWGANGTPWVAGSTELASVGVGGVLADGPSYKPALDGSSHAAPTCVAFVSGADNLVVGDTNGVADAFVRSLSTGVTTRVSVGSAGQQANGETFDVTVSGDCRRVAFTSNATNIASRITRVFPWRTRAATTNGRRQVFVRVLSGAGLDRAFRGLTFVASASNAGVPGNGDSYEPSFARAGKAVAFTSLATNLSRGDHGPGVDVYERTFTRHFVHVSGRGMQALAFATRLVSATPTGRAGNGPSDHPTTTDNGRFVAYETLASNLVRGDSNGASDVLRADLKSKRVKQGWVSKSIDGIGNGASNNPVISGAGEFVLFDSAASNLRPSVDVAVDSNGVRDMFLWNAPTRHVSLESRDWDNKYLQSASTGPATSSRGNYVLFQSVDPLIDETIMNETGNGQVYMRYMGPQ